jgi:hypothetical protein
MLLLKSLDAAIMLDSRDDLPSSLLRLQWELNLRSLGLYRVCQRFARRAAGWDYEPRSRMFITPGAAAELFLRAAGAAAPSLAPSLGGDEARPWTAESTLLSGSVILMNVGSFE